ERFITELTACVTNADRSAVAQPDTIVRPQLTPAATPTPAVAPIPVQAAATLAPPSATVASASAAPEARREVRGRTAVLASNRDNGEDDDAVAKQLPSNGPRLLVARLTGGVAKVSASDLRIPVQPVFGVTGGYPVHFTPWIVEFGAALSYT